MLEKVVWNARFLLRARAFRFASKAKTFQLRTLKEFAAAWWLRKCEAKCTASQIHDVFVRDDEVVGFERGFGLLQKRLLSQRIHRRTQNGKPLLVDEIDGLLRKRDPSTLDPSVRCVDVKRV
jgi:hypothetical protein